MAHNYFANKECFSILDKLFKEKGWQLIKNKINHICYTQFSNETTFYEIKILPSKIVVTVPLSNSAYQYTTDFYNYNEACQYIEKHLLYYNSLHD